MRRAKTRYYRSLWVGIVLCHWSLACGDLSILEDNLTDVVSEESSSVGLGEEGTTDNLSLSGDIGEEDASEDVSGTGSDTDPGQDSDEGAEESNADEAEAAGDETGSHEDGGGTGLDTADSESTGTGESAGTGEAESSGSTSSDSEDSSGTSSAGDDDAGGTSTDSGTDGGSDGASDSDEQGDDSIESTDDGADDGDDDGEDGGLDPEATTTRRLSQVELRHSYAELLGFEPEALNELPPEAQDHGFDRLVDHQTIGRVHLDTWYAIAAEASARLLSESKLDGLTSACEDSLIPPPGELLELEFGGAELSIEPDWSVLADPDAPTEMITRYAPDARVSLSHDFVDTGTYDIEFDFDVYHEEHGGVDVLWNGEVVSSVEDTLTGPQLVKLRVQVEDTGVHALAFQFVGDNLNVHTRLKTLRMTGPLDLGAESLATARRDCAAQLILETAPKAFRRPLRPGEAEALLAVFDATLELSGHADAFRQLLTVILTSPSFLYLVEVGGEADASGARALNDWELANRLSYGFCETAPDEALRLAAENGELHQPEKLRAHAERLMNSDCGRRTLRRFFSQWLGLDRLDGLNKDAELFPEYSDAVRAGMVAEVDRYIDNMLWTEGANYRTFMNSRLAWPDPSSAFLYGLTGVDSVERRELPANRAGILTSAGFLAVSSPFESTSPVKRGVTLLDRVLCAEMPPPPAEFNIVPPLPDPSLTTRERWAAHSDDPSCSVCHQYIDPLGFAFEEFDSIGRFRTEENGRAIDASGGAPWISIDDGSVVGVAELVRAMQEQPTLDLCFAQQWLRFVLGRQEIDHDRASVKQLASKVESLPLTQALLSIVDTDSFRYRFHSDGGSN